MTCPHCNYDAIPPDACRCPNCGKELLSAAGGITTVQVKQQVGRVAGGSVTGVSINQMRNAIIQIQQRALTVEEAAKAAADLELELLAYHTTPLGTAEQRPLADLERTYHHRQDVLSALVQGCRDLYLLVDPSNNQPGQPQASRLTHDTLAPHVRKRFDESVAAGQQARRILESRAVDWRNGKTGPVLEAPDLATVEAGRNGMRAWNEARGEVRLVQASRTARQKQRRQRWLVSSAFLALAVIVLLAVNWSALRSLWFRYEALQASPQADIGTVKVDLYEVSNALYEKCYRAAPQQCPAPAGSEAFSRLQQGLDNEMADMPVTHVTAFGALGYCQWLGRRLPTAAEWEQAAQRSYGSDVIRPDGKIEANEEINMRNNQQMLWQVHPPDRSGAPDRAVHLIGNAREWTLSLFDRDQGQSWDGKDEKVQLIILDGSYFSPVIRLSQSFPVDPSWPDSETGFRCVSPIWTRRTTK